MALTSGIGTSPKPTCIPQHLIPPIPKSLHDISQDTYIANGKQKVITFTLALFLSGYVLQQQTVRGLQAAIKPRLPMLVNALPPPSSHYPSSSHASYASSSGPSDDDDERELGSETLAGQEGSGKGGAVYGLEHFKEKEDNGRRRRGGIFQDVVVSLDEDGGVVGVGVDPIGAEAEVMAERGL